MGLDMYLYKETFIWKFGNNLPTLTVDYPGVRPERVSAITETCGQWRKANAIHNWFVTHAQDGVDGCQKTYVSKQQLQALLGLVHNVLADHSSAPAQLPTEGGFFFGSTDYDDYYFEDLELTQKILEGALAEEGVYYYQSSW